MKLFAKTHEWIEIADGVATVGISEFASDELGGIKYMELPEVGRKYSFGEDFGSVESHKAAEMIYSPITGTVGEVNTELESSYESIDNDAEGSGWICKFNDFDESSMQGLMTKEEYLKAVSGK